MFLWVILASIVVALLRGGHLRGLMDLPFRREILVVTAFALRLALYLATRFDVVLGDAGVWLLQAASYGLLVAATAVNRHLPGVPTVGAGVLANGLVILLNGGRMPVSATAAAAVGRQADFEQMAAEGSYLHQVLADDARLPFLADVLPTPSWLPGNYVYSVGDLLIMAGLFVLVQHLLLRRPSRPAAQPGADVA